MATKTLITDQPHLIAADCGHHVPENQLRRQEKTNIVLCRDCDEDVQRHELRFQTQFKDSPTDSGAIRTSQLRV